MLLDFFERSPYVAHMHSMDDLLPTATVASMHGVDVATVNRWARLGRLPVAVKAPGRNGANLFRRADVEALQQSGAVSA